MVKQSKKKTTSGSHSGANSSEDNHSNENKRRKVSETVLYGAKERNIKTKKVKGDNKKHTTKQMYNKNKTKTPIKSETRVNLVWEPFTTGNAILDILFKEVKANKVVECDCNYRDIQSAEELKKKLPKGEPAAERRRRLGLNDGYCYFKGTSVKVKNRRWCLDTIPRGPFKDWDNDIRGYEELPVGMRDDRDRVYDSMWARIVKASKVVDGGCWVLEKHLMGRYGLAYEGYEEKDGVVINEGKPIVYYYEKEGKRRLKKSLSVARVVHEYLFGYVGHEKHYYYIHTSVGTCEKMNCVCPLHRRRVRVRRRTKYIKASDDEGNDEEQEVEECPESEKHHRASMGWTYDNLRTYDYLSEQIEENTDVETSDIIPEWEEWGESEDEESPENEQFKPSKNRKFYY